MGSSESGAGESLAELVRLEAFQEVATLFRQFIAAAGNGHGATGIARVLQQHTGKAVIVEDAAGHVIATGDSEPRRGASRSGWTKRPLPGNASHATAILNIDRWVAVARPHGETLGAISLLDSGEPATSVDVFELEQAATVLGWELLHNRSIAEAELALWDDFTTELFEDSDVERVRSHAQRLGYDLDQPHRAVLVLPPGPVPADLRETVRRATARSGADCLVTTRASGVVVVVAHELKWADLARVLRSECGAKVRVGVGGRYRLLELSKSLADAEFALKITGSAGLPVAIFDELGVWRLLARPDAGDLQELVDHWIGALIAYDSQHRSELLKTLFSYLNEFGVLEATAGKLFVHRNTLKYRLVRIAELTGWDLNDPEHRFHLDLACRAWLARQALEGSPASPRDAGGRGTPKARVSTLPSGRTARPLSGGRARPASSIA